MQLAPMLIYLFIIIFSRQFNKTIYYIGNFLESLLEKTTKYPAYFNVNLYIANWYQKSS